MKGMVAFYPTKDLIKTRQFYEELLGLPLYMDQRTAIIYDTGYGYLGFCQYEEPRECRHVCISFNQTSPQEVDRRYQELVGRVCIASSPVWHPHYPVYSFFFQDNNGYTLELQYINEHME